MDPYSGWVQIKSLRKKAENKSTHIHSFCNFRDPVQNTFEVCDNAGDTLANSEMEESKITVEMMDTKLL